MNKLCQHWDCGWCYKPRSCYSGCVGLDKCKYKKYYKARKKLAKRLKYVYSPAQTFPRSDDPAQFLEDGRIYVVEKEYHESVKLEGIDAVFPKYAFIEMKDQVK